MAISDNIKFRAIGLLTSFNDYCKTKGIQPLGSGTPDTEPVAKDPSTPQTNPGVTQPPPSPNTLVNQNNPLGVTNHSVSEQPSISGSRPSPMIPRRLLTPGAAPERTLGVTKPTSVMPPYRPGTEDDACVSMSRILDWLDDRFGGADISQTTAKCYRRWLASYFDAVGHPDASCIRSWVPPHSVEARLREDKKDALALSVLGATHTAPGRRVPASVTELPGNDRYLSFIDPASLGLLFEYLLAQSKSSGRPRYRSGPETALFFTVSMMTGLRPNEWPTSRFLETHFDPETKLTLGPVLEVRTLKQSNRREDNPLRDRRYLVLDEWPDGQIAQLKAFMDQIEQPGFDFDGLYNRARMTLSRAWKAARADATEAYREHLDAIGNGTADAATDVPGSPTSAELASRYSRMLLISDDRAVAPYTARHIFAEEIRRHGDLTRFELAALLGHSLVTNQVYYGPLRQDLDREYDFVLPRPWPGDAEDIERWDYKINPLRSAYMQQDMFFGLDSPDGDDPAPSDETGSEFGIR